MKFENVGRRKRSWDVPRETMPSIPWIIGEIKQSKVLMSDSVDLQFNADGTSGAILVGGFRLVGNFKLVQA